MSKKYVIEIEDGEEQYICINGESEHKYYTRVVPVSDLEELTAEYVNENFGELQDGAYNRGINDAKEGISACGYCEYNHKGSTEWPCVNCCNNFENKFVCRKQKINVGDEVEDPDGDAFVITRIMGDQCEGLYSDGDVIDNQPLEKLVRTGRHFDIEGLLEEIVK